MSAPDDAPPEESPPSEPVPVITRVEPRLVDARGGTRVAAFGAGFAPGCAVFAGEVECTTEFVDRFTLRFVAPAGSGEAVLRVAAPSGVRGEGLGVAIAYVDGPSIARVSPRVVPLEGGVEIVVEGANFEPGTTVTLLDTFAPDTLVEGVDRLRFIAPPLQGSARSGALVVTTPNGLSRRVDDAIAYRALTPELASIEPNSGWISGGKRVVVRGVDLDPRAVVRFGEIAGRVLAEGDGRLDVEVPPYPVPARVDVKVEHPDGKTASLAGAFRYEPVPAPPKILDVLPRVGSTVGGFTLRIRGDHFDDGLQVRLGELTVVRRVLSTGLLDVDVPPRATPGPVALELAREGVVVRLDDAFVYESPRAPKITSIEPRSGPLAGGARVVLEGQDFPASPTVRFGGEACKSVTSRGPARLEVIAPPQREAGLVDVVVSSPETGPGVAKAGFRYEAPMVAAIQSVAPQKGTTLGGTELSIEGTGFAEGCVVLLYGKPVPTRRISGRVLEIETPPGDDQRMVDVAVRNPGMRDVVAKRAFQYDARYRG